MKETSQDREPSRERLLELEQTLREAFERRDGRMAREGVRRHAQELRRGMEEGGGGWDGAWLRETADRLLELMERARAARDALRAEIAGIDVRRRLVGAPIAAVAAKPVRRFRA